MSAPVLHVLAGPNGAGKSTFVARVLRPSTGLPFVNADEIAAQRWPGHELEHAYDASFAAAAVRDALLEARRSFITETVFSHGSKVELIQRAAGAGYRIGLHVMLVPIALSVRRVACRVEAGGHDVPEEKIRDRYVRLWSFVAAARDIADRTDVYDNSRASTPFRRIATYERGRVVASADWPSWTPPELVDV